MQILNHLTHPFTLVKEDSSTVSLKQDSKVKAIAFAILVAIGSFFAKIASPKALTASLALGTLGFYVITGFYKSQLSSSKAESNDKPKDLPLKSIPNPLAKVEEKPKTDAKPISNEIPKIVSKPPVSNEFIPVKQKPIYTESKNWGGQSSISMDDELRMGEAFGPDNMIEMFKMSQQSDCEGRIHYVVYRHLHQMKMGMIPHEYEMNYIDTLGLKGISAFEELPKIQEHLKNNKKISGSSKNSLEFLKSVLADYMNLNPEEITNQIFLDSSKIFEELKQKKVSYLKTEFIPKLLTILEEGKKNPNTSCLGCVNMVMSKEGIARWKETVEQNKPFVLFQRLEHLHSYMKPEQIEQLNNIFDNKPSSSATDE